MTGADVKRIRADLGLTCVQLASVLGVHPSTVFRWEASSAALALDPSSTRLLSIAAFGLVSKDGHQWGEQIKGALVLKGSAYALYVLLRGVYGEGVEPVVTGKS